MGAVQQLRSGSPYTFLCSDIGQPSASVEPCAGTAEPFDLDLDPIAFLHPHGLDHAAKQHELAVLQRPAAGRQAIGQPGERLERMAKDVAAAARTDLAAIDRHAAVQ